MADNGTTWASLIPEFFYELIGRIIPGGTFILGLIYTIDQSFFCEVILKQKMDGASVELPYIVIFIVFLGLSYSAGFLLTPLGDKLGKLYYKCQYKKKFKEYGKHSKWLWNEIIDKKKLLESDSKKSDEAIDKTTFPQNGKISNDDVDLLFQDHHNLVKKKYEKQSPSLSKSAADVQLCINTSAAFFIIAIVSLFESMRHLHVGNTLNECISLNVFEALIIAGGFFWAAAYRNRRFLSRQFSFSWEIQREEDKLDEEKIKNGKAAKKSPLAMKKE
jgi:hypothetical protein